MFFFIVLFLIIAPTIVLFAKGYRFDFKKGIFVYSGSITIKGVPKDFEIYLDNKINGKKKLNIINNSYTINSVHPGKHTLECKKDGYTEWKKNIQVHSGISTEFWNIFLFKKENLELEKYEQNKIKQFFLSPRDKEELVFLSETDNQKKISLLQTAKKELTEIYATDQFNFIDPSQEENVEWSSDNKMLLLPFLDTQEKKRFIITKIKDEDIKRTFDLNEQFERYLLLKEKTSDNEDGDNSTDNGDKKNNKSVVEEKILTKEKTEENESTAENEKLPSANEIEKVRWMFDKNEELVILTKDKNLYYFYLNQPEKTILIDEKVNGFDFAGNRIYYAQAPYNIVWEIKDNNIGTKRQINKNPTSQGNEDFIKLIVYDEYRIAMIDKQGNLTVFNEEKEKGEISEKIIQTDVQDIQFSNDGKKLLFWTNNEISFLMLRDWDVQPIRKKGEKNLITRFSKKINNVQWMDNYENIIFTIDNQIKSAEIDLRDKPNISDVYSANSNLKNRDAFYNKQNQTLYFKDNEILNSLIIIEKPTLLPL